LFRSKIAEAFDSRDGPLATEDEERRQLAKRKMLGNIKVSRNVISAFVAILIAFG
jgi:hypothetical protein